MSNKQYSETRQSRIVTKMRNWLNDIARKRVSGVITSDDAHTYLDRAGVNKNSIYTRLSFINSVLREPTFESAGAVPSARPSAKGRLINEWVRS